MGLPHRRMTWTDRDLTRFQARLRSKPCNRLNVLLAFSKGGGGTHSGFMHVRRRSGHLTNTQPMPSNQGLQPLESGSSVIRILENIQAGDLWVEDFKCAPYNSTARREGVVSRVHASECTCRVQHEERRAHSACTPPLSLDIVGETSCSPECQNSYELQSAFVHGSRPATKRFEYPSTAIESVIFSSGISNSHFFT